MNENRDRLPADDVARVEAAINAAREAAKGEDLAEIRKATAELQQRSHGLAEQLYKQGQTNQSAAGQSSQSQQDVKDGEVVDA